MLTSRIGRTPRAVEAACRAAAALDNARAVAAERPVSRLRVYLVPDHVRIARYWWRLARDYARRGL